MISARYYPDYREVNICKQNNGRSNSTNGLDVMRTFQSGYYRKININLSQEKLIPEDPIKGLFQSFFAYNYRICVNTKIFNSLLDNFLTFILLEHRMDKQKIIPEGS